jgi:murein L,D-transpeptidase YcbB/YkuD
MVKVFLFFSVFQFVLSCEQVYQESIPLEDLNISIQEKVKRSLDIDYLLELGIDSSARKLLIDFYDKNRYKPKWINDTTLTEEGVELKNLFRKKIQFGIPDSRYSFFKSQKTNYLQDELIITTTLAYLVNDLKNGFIDEKLIKLKPLNLVSLEVLEKSIQFDSSCLSQQILHFGPSDSNYQELANGLLNFCNKYPIDTNTFKLILSKKTPLLVEKIAREALWTKGYIVNQVVDSSTYVSALKLFQLQSGLKADAIIGSATITSLNESTAHKLYRAALSLEKWRWKNEYPKKYIRINIPEYMLRLYMNDSLKSQHRIIVGQPKTPTPQLVARIHQLVVYPYWNVPYSIASTEILTNANKNVNYFKKNDFKLYRNGVQINPRSVRWYKIKKNNFPYDVRQEYGPKNSLGILKFEFHNNYSVYIHDTPSKNLFNKEIRAFSHGCMRCERPIELAKLILENDSLGKKGNKFTPTSLDSLIELKKNFFVPIRYPVPLFVEYKTVTIIDSILKFYLDIYGRDEKYIRLMVESI